MKIKIFEAVYCAPPVISRLTESQKSPKYAGHTVLSAQVFIFSKGT